MSSQLASTSWFITIFEFYTTRSAIKQSVIVFAVDAFEWIFVRTRMTGRYIISSKMFCAEPS